jgi:hypothetical protein
VVSRSLQRALSLAVLADLPQLCLAGIQWSDRMPSSGPIVPEPGLFHLPVCLRCRGLALCSSYATGCQDLQHTARHSRTGVQSDTVVRSCDALTGSHFGQPETSIATMRAAAGPAARWFTNRFVLILQSQVSQEFCDAKGMPFKHLNVLKMMMLNH